MGQKVNPISFRISVTKDWRSRWFATKQAFGDNLHEDLAIRKHVKATLNQAGISRVQIERSVNRVRVTVHTSRPGLVFGRKRAELDALKDALHKLTKGKDVYIDVVEVKRPELEAQLVAENIAMQIERRIGFRRAMKKAMQSVMDMGADGVRIRCAGRLNGAELARTQQDRQGKVPLHTLRANVQYGFAEARTPAGAIGVKTWICVPDNMEDQFDANDAKTGKTPKGAERKPRRKRKQGQQA